VATLRLIVDDCPCELSFCRNHVGWLRQYAEEDAAVRLVEEETASA